MTNPDGWRARFTRLKNRYHARRCARAAPATAFVSSPEPRTVGSMARGRQLLAGNLLFAGHLIETRDAILWDLNAPHPAYEAEIHGFAWLDDLAAVGETEARDLAQRWVWGWIERYSQGSGPGWTPELAGRRVIRLIHHALFLLRGAEKAQSELFFKSLAQQTMFLGKTWRNAPDGLALFETLAGLIYAALSLKGLEDYSGPAVVALEKECARRLDATGAIATRNPEEMLDLFILLTWVMQALADTKRDPVAAVSNAVEQMAPSLRALRHSDGGLARFHGGGRGLDGRLEFALAASGARVKTRDGIVMGFGRLTAARTSLIIDAAPPPKDAVSLNAHASTLAFELTSGRRPLIVNCGAGETFGEEWRRAGRATPSHSTLCVDGFSSAKLGQKGQLAGAWREMLQDGPQSVPVELSKNPGVSRIEVAHDGYVASHGLTHARKLELSQDGRTLEAEDMLLAIDEAHQKTFDRKMDEVTLQGVPYVLRWHLHPDVDAEIDMGGAAVSMVLRSGEVWVFRHDSALSLSLEPSVYLERRRLRPRATKQIVLTGRAMNYASRVRWSLAKAQDTAVAIRDLAKDDADLTS